MQIHQSKHFVPHPLTLVILGVTGDLAKKKLLPALWNLYQGKVINPDQVSIIGLSRPEMQHEDFLKHVSTAIYSAHPDANQEDLENFLKSFSYISGLFEDLESYDAVKEHIRKSDEQFGECSSKLVYLAVPPDYYETIFEHVAKSGLLLTCVNEKSGPGRILVEKPFGSNAETAAELDAKLGSLFDESQIYRIDHYLAKETIQNILNFRFANHIFEPLWNKDHIESITIRLSENFGVETRGGFYDGIGALRDVGQNHILQMLAMVAMESPESFDADAIRTKRSEMLESLVPACPGCKGETGACPHVVRGQYEGYREEAGIDSNSETETFFRITARIDTPNWEGVPFVLESGKNVDETETAIHVYFKKATLAALCPVDNPHGCSNVLTFYIKPEEGISVCFWAKRPGFSRELERHTLHFRYGEAQEAVRIPEAYEYVLVEAIRGDQTLFTSTDEVRSQWAFINPVLERWQGQPLFSYPKGARTKKIGK